jgi:heme-degrading monooxygenase HmoA
MFARVTTFQGSADRFEELIRRTSEIAPAVQQQPGSTGGGYLLVDRKSGRAVTITFWDSEQAS